MYGYIYITTNLINGRKYIGQKRGKFNPNYLGSGLVLKQAVQKYGRDSFTVEVLQFANNKEELNTLEKFYIDSYNACISHDFYNIHEGGHGGNTKAGYTKEQMNTFRKNVSRGKLANSRPLTDEEKEHLRIVFSGEGNPMYGRKNAWGNHSEEAKSKISKAHKGKVAHKWTQESKIKLSSSLKEHFSDPENRKKCALKDEANGMATPVKVIFPWGEEIEFTMIKSMAKYMQEKYDVHPKTTTTLARIQKPWTKIKRRKHKYLEGLLIQKLN